MLVFGGILFYLTVSCAVKLWCQTTHAYSSIGRLEWQQYRNNFHIYVYVWQYPVFNPLLMSKKKIRTHNAAKNADFLVIILSNIHSFIHSLMTYFMNTKNISNQYVTRSNGSTAALSYRFGCIYIHCVSKMAHFLF